MSESFHIACDLGAESVRVILGRLAEGKVTLEEIHRSPNGAMDLDGTLRWDIDGIVGRLEMGLMKAATRRVPVQSLSVDSWGLDYALMEIGQPLRHLPYSYRDARADAPFAAAQKDPGREFIFRETGIQFLPINTLYQLIAEQQSSPHLLRLADHFLLIADYCHYRFTGVVSAEESLASTTQLYDPVARKWSMKLAERFGLPKHLFPPLVAPGTQLGPLKAEVAAEVRLYGVRVIATCSHDTGAAVAAVPARGDDWAYLSSGTWSLLGVELPAPLLSEAALAHNFTNEAGYGGTTRFLKNIVGLWLLQECRREWSMEQRLTYADLAAAAETAPAFRSLINPADPRFLKRGDMPARIAAYCRETGQPEPVTPAEVTRCIYESLALLYRRTLEEIENVTGRRIARLHIVGGGSQSALLNRFAANATGRTVIAGPVEATAVGNVLLQAVALGHLRSLEELRAVVARSFPVEELKPDDSAAEWDAAFARFSDLPVTRPEAS